MQTIKKPKLNILINFWSLLHEADPFDEAGLRKQLGMIKEAGFDAFFSFPDLPNLKQNLQDYGLRFAGRIDTGDPSEFAEKICANLAVGNGPINCQLGDHDTPIDVATQMTVALMKASDSQGARVHLEVHRDTCTETPEKTTAIIANATQAAGEAPLVNFDYSHPAIVKHLVPENYIERLFEDVPNFQRSNLWHIRPFNGHHCQIPITDGEGKFSKEYEECRPFIRQALQHWIDGPRPTNEFWVCPEQGASVGYNLSCFPNIWQDTVVLGKDIQNMWSELTASD